MQILKRQALSAEREDRSKKPGSLPYIWKRISKNPGAMFGLIMISAIVISSFLSPYILDHDYMSIDMRNRFAMPSMEHPFGTDELGRDIMARALYGARFTLSIGVGSCIISATIGIFLGAVTGFFGGKLDAVLMRVLDVIQSFPAMIFAIAISTVLGAGLINTIYAIGLAQMPVFARLMRGNILAIRSSEFIEAASAIRCSTPRIIFRHVIPNSISPIIVQISMTVASAGLAASALSFLGLGVSEPMPEWGAMISSARAFMRDYPHMVIVPGLFIMTSVLSLNLIGDAIRDALDPKLKD
jgi:ABC-type dipeptide/oligopeptide/nickel transport system permease subunit